MGKYLVWAAVFLLLLPGCKPQANEARESELPTPASLSLTSPAFSEGEAIPGKHTCDGEDLSPALAWSAPPEGTQSFALIMDDPDAPVGTWVHWVLYNLPANARSLAEGILPDETLPDGSLPGKNSWKIIGYGGPCPPSGTHRYFFKLYALDSKLDDAAGFNQTGAAESHAGAHPG